MGQPGRVWKILHNTGIRSSDLPALSESLYRLSHPGPLGIQCMNCIFSCNVDQCGLRDCGTGRKVEGSIPFGVIRIFHWHNPSGRTVTLGSTQPLTEMSTRNISCGRCVGLTTSSLSCADGLEMCEPLNLLEFSGPEKSWTWIALPVLRQWDSTKAPNFPFTKFYHYEKDKWPKIGDVPNRSTLSDVWYHWIWSYF